ncbi:portal protein [Novosphingobium sp. M1R2S20]|uniref:Portal protein n=1 Tax=Novosphingobium rhizovicinum TaxID=3228928 RepID=A0ABV3RCU1_9SPHN
MADMTEIDTALDSEPTDADSERLRKVHERAMRRFDECSAPTQTNRAESLTARRFITIPGAQWEDEFGEQFDNSIKLQSDKVGKGVRKIENDYRQNRIIPDFRPDGPNANDKTADTLDGMHRADSYKYKSQQARDNAVFEAIAGGFGAYRLTNELEDPRDKDNDQQRINPAALIPDADQTVFFDIGAKLYDKSDARYAFIRSTFTRSAFEEEWGGAISEFPEGVLWQCRDWFRPNTVAIAEYYEREDVDDKLWILMHELSGEERRIWASQLEDGDLAELKRDGFKARSQKRKRVRVHKYILSGGEVLEDCGLIAGECIPIVPVYGLRYFVDGIERWKGYTQDKMDDQRLFNSCVSKLMETNSLAPTEAPIFDPEQIDPTIAKEWAEANIKRAPYRLAHSLRNPDGSIAAMGPVGMVQPPQLAPVTATLIQLAATNLTEDLVDADEVKANTSAEAMDIAATRVDAKSGIYLDNIRQSVQREGEIYLSMASEVYVEEGREVETMDEDGGNGRAVLAEPYTDPKSGEHMTINDLTTGRYKVIVSVTEATATRRDKTVKAMLSVAEAAIAAQDIEMAQAALNTAVLNIDGEGSDNLIEWVRKRAVASGLVPPTEEEQAAMDEAAQNQAPDPLAQVAEAQAQDFQASAAKKAAEVAETEANTQLLGAKTIETLAKAAANDGEEQGPREVRAPLPQPIPERIEPGETPRFLRNGSF